MSENIKENEAQIEEFQGTNLEVLGKVLELSLEKYRLLEAKLRPVFDNIGNGYLLHEVLDDVIDALSGNIKDKTDYNNNFGNIKSILFVAYEAIDKFEVWRNLYPETYNNLIDEHNIYLRNLETYLQRILNSHNNGVESIKLSTVLYIEDCDTTTKEGFCFKLNAVKLEELLDKLFPDRSNTSKKTERNSLFYKKLKIGDNYYYNYSSFIFKSLTRFVFKKKSISRLQLQLAQIFKQNLTSIYIKISLLNPIHKYLQKEFLITAYYNPDTISFV